MDFKKICAEYIWIDSNNNTRSKLKIFKIKYNESIELKHFENWNFDGSSTNQATGFDSDVLLKPINYYFNPFIKFCDSYLVLCECYDKNGNVHSTNHRNQCEIIYNKCKDFECLVGFEQEYVIFNKNNTPYKWDNYHNPGIGNQGPYYCSVGGDRNFGRNISLKHLEYCLYAGLEICGTNAEVMASQWEYQIGTLNPLELSDQVWISRYILQRITEMNDFNDFNECYVSFHPKPYYGNNNDWNGSGGHTNFSTKFMRNDNGIEYIFDACKKLEKTHEQHMSVYGDFNNLRLSGNHETSSLNTFSWGISDRGKSIRIPLNVNINKSGYFEDRRPAANCDPYLVTTALMKTICL